MTDTRQIMEKAFERARRDRRIMAMVQSCVAAAMDDPRVASPHDNPVEAAHDIATAAATLLAHRFYDEDAEIKALAAERDRMRSIAEDAVSFMGPPQFILTTRDDG